MAILSPSEGLFLAPAFTASGSSLLENFSGQAFPSVRAGMGLSDGTESPAASRRGPQGGGTAFLLSTGWTPHPGARLGSASLPYPRWG